MRRIGLFSGTFDPIHDGHLEVARAAVESLELDQFYYLVEAMPRGSKQPVDIAHRQAMIDLAAKHDDHLSRLDVAEDRFSLDQTLSTLESQFPDDELYFVFGADVFLRMNPEQWPNLDLLFKHNIVVFERGIHTHSEIQDYAKSLGIVTAIISSTHPHHASTDVRVKPHNKSVWVPKRVGEYIDSNQLY